MVEFIILCVDLVLLVGVLGLMVVLFVATLLEGKDD